MSYDIHITTLCALALGYKIHTRAETELPISVGFEIDGCRCWKPYDPLNNDMEAMELVKKLVLRISRTRSIPEKWGVYSSSQFAHMTMDEDLNRAIVQCVSSLQEAKTAELLK